MEYIRKLKIIKPLRGLYSREYALPPAEAGGYLSHIRGSIAIMVSPKLYSLDFIIKIA